MADDESTATNTVPPAANDADAKNRSALLPSAPAALVSLSAVAATADARAAPLQALATGTSRLPTPSSPGSHGCVVLDVVAAGGVPDRLADLDLAASWSAAVEAAVAGLSSATTAPTSLATLTADPHAPADLIESPTAWTGFLQCLPRLLGDAEMAEPAAAFVTSVASTAAVEAPALLPALASAAVRGLEGPAAVPAPAVACVTALLSHALPRSWGPFTPPMLGVAAGAVARATARSPPDGTPSPPLLAVASSPSSSAAWLRRWAATPRVGAALWEALGPAQIALHERAVVEAGERVEDGPSPPALAVSTTIVAAAVSTKAGRAGLADVAAALLALARLCGSPEAAAAGTAREGLTALAAADPDTAAALVPPGALVSLVERGEAGVLAALATTPAGVDALLRAVMKQTGTSVPWPLATPPAPLPPSLAAVLENDPLGRLHLLPSAATPSALAAAVASRTPPGTVALAQAGADPASLAEAWMDASSAWVPQAPLRTPCPAAWAVCAAAASLVALHPAAVQAAVTAAIAGVPPAFAGPSSPPRPPVEDVSALYAAHGEAVGRLSA